MVIRRTFGKQKKCTRTFPQSKKQIIQLKKYYLGIHIGQGIHRDIKISDSGSPVYENNII